MKKFVRIRPSFELHNYCIDRDGIRGRLSHGWDSLNFGLTGEERAIVEMESTRYVRELRSFYRVMCSPGRPVKKNL